MFSKSVLFFKLIVTFSDFQHFWLRLEFGKIEENMELPLPFLTASTLYEIWNLRTKGSRTRRSVVRAKLEARIAILRTTRHTITATMLEEMMDKLPRENLNYVS